MRGAAAADLLFSDWAVMKPGTELLIDTPEAMAGAVWRIGGRALALLHGRPVPAEEALALGLCDQVTDRGDRLAGRSRIALDAAAALISRHGGDALERAVFAWLFASGSPQEGLDAFLARRRPKWDC